MVIPFLDISRVLLHSLVRRELFVAACREDTECPRGFCWKLLKAMYGFSDACAEFVKKKKTETVVDSLGYRVGLACATLSPNVSSGKGMT